MLPVVLFLFETNICLEVIQLFFISSIGQSKRSWRMDFRLCQLPQYAWEEM